MTDKDMVLLVPDSYGIYVPNIFARLFEPTCWGFEEDSEDWKTLLNGPDDENYWDAWNRVSILGRHMAENGSNWFLHQDDSFENNLFAVCIKMCSQNNCFHA